MKRKQFIRNHYLILFVISTLLFISGCFTNKNFMIKSEPEGALVIRHNKEGIDEPLSFTKIIGEAPAKDKITFIGADDTSYYTLEKRGYRGVTESVTKNSQETIVLKLERINDIPETVFDRQNLKNSTFYLLPIRFDIVLHGGVGAIDRYKLSPKLSEDISSKFNQSLLSTEHMIEVNFDDKTQKVWGEYSEDINTFLTKLNPKRLQYYTSPPFIFDKVPGFTVGESLKNLDSKSYLLYVYGKCIKASSGRIVGNAALNVASGAVEGYQAAQGRTFASDANAFRIDNSTIVSFYVIDPHTSEVLTAETVSYPMDITNPKAFEMIALSVRQFPEMQINK
ncbi:MAG: hypothetical protein ABIK92_06215 [Pseudomonadota bacterium]